jgi:hypothetical protein
MHIVCICENARIDLSGLGVRPLGRHLYWRRCLLLTRDTSDFFACERRLWRGGELRALCVARAEPILHAVVKEC